jgi:Uma2 family endonuclease
MDRVLQRPPLLCVEIMSPEDRLGKVREWLQDFVAMGVHDIWVIDPEARRAYVCVAGEFSESDEDTLRIAGTEIHVRLADLWAELER